MSLNMFILKGNLNVSWGIRHFKLDQYMEIPKLKGENGQALICWTPRHQDFIDLFMWVKERRHIALSYSHNLPKDAIIWENQNNATLDYDFMMWFSCFYIPTKTIHNKHMVRLVLLVTQTFSFVLIYLVWKLQANEQKNVWF